MSFDRQRGSLVYLGGLGYLGRSLIANSGLCDCKVVVVGRKNLGRINNYQAISDYTNYKLKKSDNLIFGAAPTDEKFYFDSKNVECYIGYFRSVMSAFIEQKSVVESFNFISSGAVYGLIPEGVHPCEDYEGDLSLLPENKKNYGLMKRECESIVRTFAPLFAKQVTITRLFTIFDPASIDPGSHYMIPSFLRVANLLGRIQVRNPLACRSFLDGRDFIEAMLALTSNSGVYNLGSRVEWRAKEVAELMSLQLSLPSVEVVGAAVSDFYVPSMTKFFEDTGLRFNEVDLSLRIGGYLDRHA